MPDSTQDSRLHRATNATLRTADALTQAMDGKLRYTTDFRAQTLPTPSLQQHFDAAYSLPPLLPRHFKTSGAAVNLIFEQPSGPHNLHGAVAATIADCSGTCLHPSVKTIWVQEPLNTRYRDWDTDAPVAAERKQRIKDFLKTQGAAVITNMVNWYDTDLSFKSGGLDPSGILHGITSFVVTSNGNDGQYGPNGAFDPQQTHDAIAHFSPLSIHVGAAEHTLDAQGRWNGAWHIGGYTSANGPTLLAPVMSETKAIWKAGGEAERILGSSASAPYLGAALTALNANYGPYLAREQILYALLATARKIEDVGVFGSKNPLPRRISYFTNAQGLPYNPQYGGFGMVDLEKADRLLGQMVKLTQQHPARITTPIESKADYDADRDPKSSRGADKKYTYRLTMDEGIALKTTFGIQFKDGGYGKISVESPAGTQYELVTSKTPALSFNYTPVHYSGEAQARRPAHPPSRSNTFSLCTTHAWAGEPTQGTWMVRSTRPIQHLEMFQHHFRTNDIVQDLTAANVEALTHPALPAPDISNAVAIPQMDRSHYPAAPMPASRIIARGIVHKAPSPPQPQTAK